MKKKPTTSYEFTLEWMKKTQKVCFNTGKYDSAALWQDAIDHLEYLKQEHDKLDNYLHCRGKD